MKETIRLLVGLYIVPVVSNVVLSKDSNVCLLPYVQEDPGQVHPVPNLNEPASMT